MNPMSKVIGHTNGLCPRCLRTIPVTKVVEDDKVYLVKECPEHGPEKVLIWRGEADYLDMDRYAAVHSKPARIAVQEKDNCPQICGLCPDHVQHTCLVVMEITNGCNLKCPVCFASSNQFYRFNPSLEVIRGMYQTMLDYVEHPIVVQISGGEPTIRDDLPEIVRMGKEMGIDHIELNTNGIRLAEDIGFLRRLKEAGVDELYFSFDGLHGDIYKQTCGRDILAQKLRCIENCAEVGMGITLVCVVSPNINLDRVGEVIEFAKSKVPTIKGVHFQPISYFGRFPISPKDSDRVTIPDLLRAIEDQTKGELRMDNFIPTSCSNVHCDAKSMSVVMEDGSLFPLTSRAFGPPKDTTTVANKTRREIADLWRFIDDSVIFKEEDDGTMNEWGDFVDRAKTHYLTVSAMAFQDAWTSETDRFRNCCIHTVTPDGKLIPFCLFNINSMDGRTLYRHEMWSKFSENR